MDTVNSSKSSVLFQLKESLKSNVLALIDSNLEGIVTKVISKGDGDRSSKLEASLREMITDAVVGFDDQQQAFLYKVGEKMESERRSANALAGAAIEHLNASSLAISRTATELSDVLQGIKDSLSTSTQAADSLVTASQAVGTAADIFQQAAVRLQHQHEGALSALRAAHPSSEGSGPQAPRDRTRDGASSFGYPGSGGQLQPSANFAVGPGSGVVSSGGGNQSGGSSFPPVYLQNQFGQGYSPSRGPQYDNQGR